MLYGHGGEGPGWMALLRGLYGFLSTKVPRGKYVSVVLWKWGNVSMIVMPILGLISVSKSANSFRVAYIKGDLTRETFPTLEMV